MLTKVYIDGSLVTTLDPNSRNTTPYTFDIQSDGTNPFDGAYVIRLVQDGTYTGGYSRRLIIQVNGFDWLTTDYFDVNTAIDTGTNTFQ